MGGTADGDARRPANPNGNVVNPITPNAAVAALKGMDIPRRESMVATVVPLVAEWGIHPQGNEVVGKAFGHGTVAQRKSMAATVVPLASKWCLHPHGAWSLIAAVVHGNAAQREAMVEYCLPYVGMQMAVSGSPSHLLWEILFSATAEQHAVLYSKLLPLVAGLAKDARGTKTLGYLTTFGSEVQRQQIRSSLRPLGLGMQQCGNCGHHSLLAGDWTAHDAPKSTSCGLCSTLPSVDSTTFHDAGNHLREAERKSRLLREHERLDPSNCTLHALKQLCRLAGATELPTPSATQTHHAIWKYLRSYIVRSQVLQPGGAFESDQQ